MNTKPIIVLINGSIASGKTSVALKLAQSCNRGVHLDVDIIRNFIKGGFIEEDELFKLGDTVSARFPLKMLAVEIVTAMVNKYIRAGFSVFISDPIYLKELEKTYRDAFNKIETVNKFYFYLDADFKSLLERVRARSSPENESDSKIAHYNNLFNLFDKSKWIVVATTGLTQNEVMNKIQNILNTQS